MQEVAELTSSEVQAAGEDVLLYFPLPGDQTRFHQSQAQFRWLFGGNQSGKSYANLMDLAWAALGIHPWRKLIKDGFFWCATESWELVRDILWSEYLSKFIPKSRIVNIQYANDKVPRKIFLDNGNQIIFKAFNQGRTLFQSKQIDAFYGDEQCCSDFKGIFNEIQARLLVRNGYMSWSMTPIVPQVYLEERIESLPSTDETFFLDLEDNRISRGGYIDDRRVDELISEWSDEIQTTRVKGRFSSYYGSVYQSFSRSIHIVNPFKIPEGWTRYRSIDFGFVNPFVCLWLAKDNDENWCVYQEYYRTKTGIQEHIQNINLLSKDEKYFTTYVDPEDPGSISELRKAGIRINLAQKDVARGIECVQGKLKKKANGKPSLYIFSNCKNVIKEFALYSYPKGSKSDLPAKESDHCMDALRYCLYTSRKGVRKGRASY